MLDIIQRYAPIVRAIKKNKLESKKIVEIGGTGEGLGWYLPDYRIIDCDLNFVKKPLPNTELIKTSAEKLPLPDKSAELVVSVDTLEHLTSQKKQAEAIKEMLRVARKTVILAVPTGHQSLEAHRKFHQFLCHRQSCQKHGYLEEHLKLGHPEKETILNLIRQADPRAKITTGKNANLTFWLLFQKIYFKIPRLYHLLRYRRFWLFCLNPILPIFDLGSTIRTIFYIQKKKNLPSERVDPALYTRQYFLKSCSGYKEFKKSQGQILEPRLKRIAGEIPLERGFRLLDIGCGRGELVFWAAKKGLNAIGIDYSKEAINLAQEAFEKQPPGVRKRAGFKLMDAKKLSFRKNSFDVVVLVEILEHLYLWEQEIILKKIKRILKSNGVLIVHTAPNRWFNDLIYRFWCYPISTFLISFSNWLTGKKYPNLPRWHDLRTEHQKKVHVNEPTYFYLRKLFKKNGFKGKIKTTNLTVIKPELSWKDKLYNRLIYLYPISNYFPLNILWGNDFLAILNKE